MLPKVLIFTITYSGKDYCLDAFIENAKKFTYPNKHHIIIDNSDDGGVYYKKLKEKLEPQGFEVFRTERGNSSREALARSQNFARKIALEEKYPYIFSLESDIIPKPNVIEALMVHSLDMVCGLYMIGDPKGGIRIPCVTLYQKNEKTGTMGTRRLFVEELEDYIYQGLKVVASAGLGCSLMYTKILEDVKFTYIPGLKSHSDVFFAVDINRKKIPIIVDTDIVCDHLNSSWDLVKDR